MPHSKNNEAGMKKIEAVVEPFYLDEVKRSLENENVQRLTIFEVKGVGRQPRKIHAAIHDE
jgi:nitrogen regulatory protein PII